MGIRNFLFDVSNARDECYSRTMETNIWQAL